jgi:hypothetical protein
MSVVVHLPDDSSSGSAAMVVDISRGICELAKVRTTHQCPSTEFLIPFQHDGGRSWARRYITGHPIMAKSFRRRQAFFRRGLHDGFYEISSLITHCVSEQGSRRKNRGTLDVSG